MLCSYYTYIFNILSSNDIYCVDIIYLSLSLMYVVLARHTVLVTSSELIISIQTSIQVSFTLCQDKASYCK